MPRYPKQFVGAYAPFPRSTWIHPNARRDSFDRVCESIWRGANEAKEVLDRGQSSPPSSRSKACNLSDNDPRSRTEEQQKETDDVLLSAQYEEDKKQYHTDFTLPCPYLSGRRHPRVGEPARVKSLVMEAEMKLNEGEAEGKRKLEKDAEEKQRRTGNSLLTSVSQSRSFAREPHLQENKHPSHPPKLLPHLSDESGSVRKHDSPSNTKKAFPPVPTIEAGIQLHPTEPSALGKMHGQCEIPLSFHPHDIPTATLASGTSAPAQASVQGKAEAPQAISKTNAPPPPPAAVPVQQEAYDLLADFPLLQPPKTPFALGVFRRGNPKTKDAKGKRNLIHSSNHCQDSRASHERRTENIPHKVSSICARQPKSSLDLQTFGQRNSPTTSSKELKANKQPPPRVAGADGVGVNARSWASVAKAGMKQAAAPQEKARPCTFQPIVTINRAKAGWTAAPNFPNQVMPCRWGINPGGTALYQRPQPRNMNVFVRPGYRPPHQHFGARAHRANCPPGFRCPRFPFQQARGSFASSHRW